MINYTDSRVQLNIEKNHQKTKHFLLEQRKRLKLCIGASLIWVFAYF